MGIEVYIILGLLVIGYTVGQFLESKHFKSINEREQSFLGLVATNSKDPVGTVTAISRTELVKGSCCISVDYFKRLVTALRKLFGGNIRSYETLLDRARREAILRLKESCPGAEQIINLRIETSSITKGQAQQTACVEVLAYGTAIYTGNSLKQPATPIPTDRDIHTSHSDNFISAPADSGSRGRGIDRDP